VSVFTRRNAVVGYVAIKAAGKALERRAAKAARTERKRHPRLPLYIALGIVSFGILAAFAAYAAKRRASTPLGDVEQITAPAPEEAAEVVIEEVSEVVETVSESTPAT
jgi:hypothetical protein